MRILNVLRAMQSISSSQLPLLARYPLLPLTLLIPAAWLCASSGLDQFVADWFYALEGGRWLLRDHTLTEAILHKGGRNFSILLWLALLVSWLTVRRRTGLELLSQTLLYLLICAALSNTMVSSLKHLTHMDCPWDLVRYGGDRPLIGLFESRPAGMGAGVCWPAGHSGAGYAWVSLYFAALAIRPQWRLPALGFGLSLGLVFGISQQLRGAHFLSHDLWTVSICWALAALMYRLMLSSSVQSRHNRPSRKSVRTVGHKAGAHA